MKSQPRGTESGRGKQPQEEGWWQIHAWALYNLQISVALEPSWNMKRLQWLADCCDNSDPWPSQSCLCWSWYQRQCNPQDGRCCPLARALHLQPFGNKVFNKKKLTYRDGCLWGWYKHWMTRSLIQVGDAKSNPRCERNECVERNPWSSPVERWFFVEGGLQWLQE